MKNYTSLNESIIDDAKEHFQRNKNKYLLGGAILGALALHGYARNPEGMKKLGQDIYDKTEKVVSKVGGTIKDVGSTLADDASIVYNRVVRGKEISPSKNTSPSSDSVIATVNNKTSTNNNEISTTPKKATTNQKIVV